MPFKGSFPNGECIGYRSEKGINAIQKTLYTTLQKLKDYDFLMVFGEHIDNVGLGKRQILTFQYGLHVF